MDRVLEQQIGALIVRSEIALSRLSGVVRPDTLQEYKWLWEFVTQWFSRYKALPTELDLRTFLRSKIPPGGDDSFVEGYCGKFQDLQKLEVTLDSVAPLLDRIRNEYLTAAAKEAIQKALKELQARRPAAAIGELRAVTALESTGDEREGNLADPSQIAGRLAGYEERKKNAGKMLGIPCGIDEIDQATRGFRPGELILVMADTKAGKSTVMMNFGYVAWQRGYNVLVISREMPKEQYEQNWDSRHAQIPYQALRNGELTDEQEKIYRDALKAASESKAILHVVDTPADATPALVETKIITGRVKYDLVIVDYLSLFTSRGSPDDPDWLALGEIAKDLRNIGRQHRVAMLSAVQTKQEAFKKTERNLTAIGRSFGISHHCDLMLDYVRLNEMEAQFTMPAARDIKEVQVRVYTDYDRKLVANLKSASSGWKDVGL